MKPILILSLLLGCLLLASCSSNRRLSQIHTQTDCLSKQLGFKITPKDNLRLYTEAAQWLGTPYHYGGNSRKGVDCSGLICQIYKQVYHQNLERSTSEIAEKNCRKISKSNLKTGDLVFFNTSEKKRKGINHVGLFLKNGYFIHATRSKGVMINQLEEDYYQKAWKQGGRVK